MAQILEGDTTQPNRSFEISEIKLKQELLEGIPCWGFADKAGTLFYLLLTFLKASQTKEENPHPTLTAKAFIYGRTDYGKK